jgi:hypothetical protein
MNQLEMHMIRPRITARLKAAGYLPTRQSSYKKWSRGRGDNVWFGKRQIRTNLGNEGASIIRDIAGAPNGSVCAAQQGKFDSWYTDGYKSYGNAAIAETRQTRIDSFYTNGYLNWGAGTR